MKKIDRRIVIVTAFVIIVGMAFGLMRYLISLKEDPPMRPPVEAKRYVDVETIAYGTIQSPVFAPGRLSSVNEIDIVAEAPGKIITNQIPLKKSSNFKKGDVLFTIYQDEAELALKARKSQFLNTLANIIPDIRIDFPDKEPQFMEFFLSISLTENLPPFPEIQDEKMRIFLTTRNVLSEYFNIQKDELQLSRHTIRAPFNGTYLSVYLEAGAYTNTGGRVARAINTGEMELEVPLERFDAQWVNIGDPVRVVSDRRNLEWTGTVIRKSQFVDENTQSQEVFVKIRNQSKNTLLSGEYLTAHFPGHPIEQAMEMPRNAVFNSNEVFVVVDGRLQKRAINIIKKNESTLIFNGLDEGEMLVMQPLINVLEGTLVEIRGQSPSAPQGPDKKKELQGKPNKQAS